MCSVRVAWPNGSIPETSCYLDGEARGSFLIGTPRAQFLSLKVEAVTECQYGNEAEGRCVEFKSPSLPIIREEGLLRPVPVPLHGLWGLSSARESICLARRMSPVRSRQAPFFLTTTQSSCSLVHKKPPVEFSRWRQEGHVPTQG